MVSHRALILVKALPWICLIKSNRQKLWIWVSQARMWQLAMSYTQVSTMAFTWTLIRLIHRPLSNLTNKLMDFLVPNLSLPQNSKRLTEHRYFNPLPFKTQVVYGHLTRDLDPCNRKMVKYKVCKMLAETNTYRMASMFNWMGQREQSYR
jgi:hypothetical protein